MIVGFNLTKIDVERKGPIQGKISVNHDVRLDNVTQQPLPLQGKKDALVFDFTFTIDYKPAVGHITLGGNVIYYHEDPKKLKDVSDTWKKDKKVASDVSLEVLNLIFVKCNVKALALANDLSLPAHLPLPKINLKDDPRQYIG